MIWLHRNQAFRILPGYNRIPLNDFSTNSEIMKHRRSRVICITVLRRLFPLETARARGYIRHVVLAKYTYLDLACRIPVEVQMNLIRLLAR